MLTFSLKRTTEESDLFAVEVIGWGGEDVSTSDVICDHF